MNQSQINVRYAKAFFGLAQDKNLTAALRNDARLISGVCNESEDFILMIESPVVKTSQKIKILKSIFTDKVNALSLNFLVLIASNKREKYIPGIFRNLEDLYRKEEGIKTAVLTSASALNTVMVAEISKLLESRFDAKVELSEKVDERLIGGFVLRIDDQQYDASIATQLKKIKEQLLQTELK